METVRLPSASVPADITPIAQWVIDRTKGQRNGYFLDLGAGGIAGNNTTHLELDYGWTGLCVEPLDHFRGQLALYRACHLSDIVVAPVAAENVVFREVRNTLWCSGLVEFRRRNDNPDHIYADTLRRAVTFETLFQWYRVPYLIDFWNLDTEGSELALLKCFPWKQHQVRLIAVEHLAWEFGPARQIEIREFMLGLGYHLDQEGVQDDYYTLY